MATPKIKLYTNHRCPWAHRAHISLAELGLPFEEEIIDLSTPRTAEYLKINPRGLVPSIEYNGEILTESGIISDFLADAHPSHLIPVSNAPGGALQRARIAFFVDTFISKVNSNFFKASFAKNDDEVEGFVKEYVNAVVKELEPLLANAAFFSTAATSLRRPSFIIRLFTLPKHGILPAHILTDISSKAPNFYKWGEAVSKHPSVTGIYNEEDIVKSTKERLAKLRAA
ncbi:glutathione S-transferase domain-containing protein [Daldinia childiae]|uniref:glutathione S-transferase domain-containing protein n=1 Tax=Daldinia childiae TaxID=326645 RepID=UPI0014451D7C|nr:glutathione S-transferase domain-containing protein [Daldinia childiae]KAF3065958.1 glutathione S-transferase domain-containing protein [Daldinia childiae]